MESIEFRIRERNDNREWKDIPVEIYDTDDPNWIAQGLGWAIEHDGAHNGIKVIEVRWNYQTASDACDPMGQGHYVAVSGRYG